MFVLVLINVLCPSTAVSEVTPLGIKPVVGETCPKGILLRAATRLLQNPTPALVTTTRIDRFADFTARKTLLQLSSLTFRIT